MLLWAAFGAVGGVWSAFGSCGRVLKVEWCLSKVFFGYLLFAVMTTTDRNDLVPAQEKLEWVTPKISLMTVEETFGLKANKGFEEGITGPS